jgi:hypothetical protein
MLETGKGSESLKAPADTQGNFAKENCEPVRKSKRCEQKL